MQQRTHLVWPKALQSPHCRRVSLLRLLVSSYGLAAIAAVLAAFAGAGFWTSALIFWLGGAATVFAFGFILTRREPFNPRTEHYNSGQYNAGVSARRMALEPH